MTPVMCRVKHDPPNSYGDCLRACVATVMDMDAEQVPHFADNGADGETSLRLAREWLATHGRTVACFAFPGDGTLPDVLEYMGEINPDVTWLLFGSLASGGDHVVVCRGGEVIHNPAWIPESLKGPTSAGIWQIWIVVSL